MKILPAIDLKGGQVVRLEQGRAEAQTTYSHDPLHIALEWEKRGAQELHIVDLDGAFTGQPCHLDVIARLAEALTIPIELGGGLRTAASIEQARKAGVHRVILGTLACQDLDFIEQLVQEFGGDHLAVGLDAKEGMVATKGWTETSQWQAADLAREVSQRGVSTLIYTDIATDGMFTGPNIPALQKIIQASEGQVIASGGIASVEHIQALQSLEKLYGAIVGKALYDQRITLEEILAC